MDDVYYSKSSIEEAFKKFPLNWNSFIKDTINAIKPSDVRYVVHDNYCPNCGAKLISE